MKLQSLILRVLLLQCAVFAQFSSDCPIFSDPNDYIDDPNTLENGLFECGDPNLTIYDFTPPIVWERIPHPESKIWTNGTEPNAIDCYAALLSSFDPDPDNHNTWSIDSPYEGETFVLLSTGGFGVAPNSVDDDQIKGSMISQKVFLNEGDVMLGAYFFGTLETNASPIYNDYGRIYAKLEPNVCPDPNELIINGGFDSDTIWTRPGLWTIGDPNVSDPNIPDPNLPDPNVATYNVYQQQIIDPNGLSQTIPFVPDADYLVSIDVLTGTFDSGDAFTVTLGNETKNMIAEPNTTITQLFTPTDGDSLTISWNHAGTINIDNVSVRYNGQCPVDEFEIAYIAVKPNLISPNGNGSTEDWLRFKHIVDSNQVGLYILKCEVVDTDDQLFNSYLAVDGLRICRGGKPDSDLNDDCDVNLIDYSIFSEAWLSFCPNPRIDDPNFPGDPNDYPDPPTDPNILEICESADFDNSWYVDVNDLVIMFDPNWLISSSSL